MELSIGKKNPEWKKNKYVYTNKHKKLLNYKVVRIVNSRLFCRQSAIVNHPRSDSKRRYYKKKSGSMDKAIKSVI